MKVLHIIGSVDPASGGPIEAILRLKELTDDVVEHEVVSLDSPTAPFLSTSRVTTHALGQSRKARLRAIERFGYSAALVPWLKGNIGKYDCAIVHGLWNYSKYAACAALRKSKVPYFVFVHGMMDPWFRRRYPLKHCVKQVSWLLFQGPLMSAAKAAIFTTNEECRVSRGVFRGFSYRERVIRLGTNEPPPATEMQIHRFREQVPDLGDRQFILFLSRIHPKKGCDLLIKAFAAVVAEGASFDLVIAGPDEMNLQSELGRLATELGVSDRIHWPGMLVGDAKWGAFRKAQAFILPSHQENFGLVVAEALACGTPVLITNKVQVWNEVASSNAGLVENDDLLGVTRLLHNFEMLGSPERDGMRQRARQCFEDHLDIRATRQSFLDLLSSEVPANL